MQSTSCDRYLTSSSHAGRRAWLAGAAASVAVLPGSSLLAGPSVAVNAATQSGRVRVYVGTFSSPLKDVLPTQVDLPPGNGRGIHIFEMDTQTGAFHEVGIAELGTSPSCLVLDARKAFLYSANETDRVGDNKHGTVSAWKIDPTSGMLTLLNSVTSGGAGPTYVSLHPNGKFLLVANYFGGSIAVHPILADGKLGEAIDVKTDEGNIGPTKAVHAPVGSFAFSGHDRTHAHMIETDLSGKWVIHCDLGQDRIYIWSFDASSGKLTPAPKPFETLPPGDGPRHFHFHPNGKWFYSIQEEGSTVVLFDFDARDGRLVDRQTISTLPSKFKGSNFCSEILVSADGRFVYAGNRLHDSIAIFEVRNDGSLEYRGEVWTQGNYPRSFTIDPSGNWLVCCNQRSDNLAIFRVDRKTGGLAFSGEFAAVGNPSVVRFAS